jgi:branched-chain amino acid transport system ATP-binding protein
LQNQASPIRLFKELSVLENVEVSKVCMGSSRRSAQVEAKTILDEVGLNGQEKRLSGELSYGDQRRLEIARALALSPKFLLLDEPAAGLNEAESDHLLEFLKTIPNRRNVGMLIVDHDMRLIMRLCSRLHVLNYGKTIAEGSPDEIRENQVVKAAYLGKASER